MSRFFFIAFILAGVVSLARVGWYLYFTLLESKKRPLIAARSAVRQLTREERDGLVPLLYDSRSGCLIELLSNSVYRITGPGKSYTL